MLKMHLPLNVWSWYGVAQLLKVKARHGYVCIFILQPTYLLVYTYYLLNLT